MVCAVNGVAAGAGANIALACDFVFAAESASFIQAFSKISLIPDSGGTYFLPRLVGRAKATELAFLGGKLSAKEAQRLGMIYQVVADEDLLETVEGFAQKLASMPTKALAYTKALFNQSFDNDLEAQLEQEAIYQAKSGITEDYREGVQAFLEKRKPQYQGK